MHWKACLSAGLFPQGGKELKIDASFFGSDKTRLSPALQLCDKGFVIRPIKDSRYISDLLKIVKNNSINLIVPTVDLDLRVLSGNNSKFASVGCRLLVSNPDVVDICQDKRKTYRFLVSNGFDTPSTMTVRTALSKRSLNWPCFVKPWDGYASRGNAIVANRRQLGFFGGRIPNAICQEYIEGIEHTCDVYVDFDMKVRCVVPRKRIEVRAGEVSKGQIVRHPAIMRQTAELVERLGAGPGVITIQLFLTRQRRVKFIEINPRFGGGVPLSIKAGTNFPKWILQELLGRRPRIRFDGFKDGLIMLRYDGEVWLES